MSAWRPQLSPRGRQKFGEWLANRLIVAAGALLALIAVLGLIGSAHVDRALTAGSIVFAAALAAVAILAHYLSAERLGEDTPTAPPERNERWTRSPPPSSASPPSGSAWRL